MSGLADAIGMGGLAVIGGAFVVGAVVARRRAGAAGVVVGLMAALGVALVARAALASGPSTVAVAVVGTLLVLGFPSGRLGGIPGRTAAALVVAAGPVAVLGPAWFGEGAVTGLAVAVAVALWWRVERSTGDERLRLLWLVWAVATGAVVAGHLFFLVDGVESGPVPVVVGLVGVGLGLVPPVALTAALLDPRRRDVRVTISMTALGVVMVDLVLAVVGGTLAVADALLGHPAPRVVAEVTALVVAAGFGPTARRVRTALDQVLFGGRPDPVGVVTTLGGELRRGGDPQRWLEAVRGAVDLPYAALVHGDEILACSGSPGGPTTTVELRAGEEHVGDLVVGVGAEHPRLPTATRGALELVAAPLARALQSTRLAEELQRSRERLVLASEEERRRLRRDLHDGLGPVLAGVAYTADAARNVLDDDTRLASELLVTLREDVAGAVAEVRRLVHDLRPPALDQLGLVPALRQQAARLHHGDGTAVRVAVEALDVGALPAAVEVASYRLVCEAMLNVARHSGAATAAVRIARADGVLELSVTDDGAPTGPWIPGVGLTSMRERIEQVGGRLEVGAVAGGGSVRAVIPVG